MKWLAVMEDGSQIIESDSISFNELDKSQVSSLFLTEDTNKFIPYDESTGLVRFNNINMKKLSELPKDTKLVLEVNDGIPGFKFTGESKEILDSILDYGEVYKVGFDKHGDLNVNGSILTYVIEVEKDHGHKMKSWNEIDQYKKGYSDIKNKASGKIVTSRTSQFCISYQGEVEVTDDLSVKLKCRITYDLESQSVTAVFSVTSEVDARVNLVLTYNGHTMRLPLNLSAGVSIDTRKVLDLLK